MNPSDTVEYNSLNWVKKELDLVLDDAQKAFNIYIDDTSETDKLQECIDQIHLIHGTLLMVELYGAAMLAEEIEELLKALSKDEVSGNEEIYQLIMGAMLRLPDYLDGLVSGNKDIPIVLLPVLNDLRAARNESLLSENLLFFPDVDADAVEEIEVTAEQADKLQALAKRLRPHFQLGLLTWFKDEKPLSGLKRIQAVINELEKHSAEKKVNRLWTVASALLESLIHKGINSSISIKLLIGKIDRLNKELIDKGEAALARSLPDDVIKNLLYYIARSDSLGDRVAKIKEAYRLNELLPPNNAENEAALNMGGPNIDLLQTVSQAIREDFTEVKDALEVFVHGDDQDKSKLEPLPALLVKIADTMGMLSLGQPRQMILDQKVQVEKFISGEVEASDQEVMDVASVLLNAEAKLNNFIARKSSRSVAGETGEVEHDSEYQEVLSSVAREALQDFSQAKQFILMFADAPDDTTNLEQVIKLFSEAGGAMFMAPLDILAPLIRGISEYIETVLLKSRQVIPDQLDVVADAITSIEYYLEAVIEGRKDLEADLNFGRSAVEKLRLFTTEVGSAEPAPQVTKAEEIEIPGVETELTTEAEEGLDLADEDVSADDLALDVSLDLGVSAEDLAYEEQLVNESELESETEVPEPPPPAPVAKTAVTSTREELPIISDDVDEEIFEIFIEEALEVLGEINESLPTWKADNGNEEARGTVRRSFHTLKGSGRLIGAMMIGEFAWSIENMLNRVIDNTISLTPEVFSVLDEAVAVLPQLIEQMQGNKQPVQNLYGLMDHADALSKGEKYLPPADTGVASEAASEETGSEAPDLSAALESEFLSDVAEEQPVEAEETETELPVTENLIELEEPAATEDLSFEVDETGFAEDELAFDTSDIELDEEPEEIEASLPEPEITLEEEPVELGEEDTLDLTDSISFEAVPEEDDLAFTSEEISLDSGDESEDDFSLTAEDEDFLDISYDESELSIEPVEESAGLNEIPAKVEIDAELFKIFRAESEGHLDTIRQILIIHQTDGSPVLADDNLIRALHTLYGSARTAEVEEIGSVCGIAEKYIKAKHDSGELEVEPDGVTALKELVATVTEVLGNLETGEDLTLNQPLVSKFEQLYQHEAQKQPESAPVAADVPDNALVSYGDIDDELVDIFLEEADELVEGAEKSLQSWKQDVKDIESVNELKRILHTLKGGARMAELTPIGDLTHALETAIIDAADVDPTSRLPAMQEALDTIVSMLSKVTNREPIESAAPTIAKLNQAKKGGATKPAPAPVSKPEPAFISKPEPDIEMSDIQAEDISFEAEEVKSDEFDLSSLDVVEDLETEFSSPDSSDNFENEIDIDITAEDEDEVLEVESDELAGLDSTEETIDAVAVSEPEAPQTVVEEPVVETGKGLETSSASHVFKLDRTNVAHADEEKTQPKAVQEQVRVRAELLNDLVNNAGEVNIYNSRFNQQLSDFGYNITEFDQTVERLREQLRKLEIETETQILSRHEKESSQYDVDFDPLEMDRYSTLQQLSRALMESVSDLESIKDFMGNTVRESETLLQQQSRISTELQESLMRTRMIKFNGLTSRLSRIVRQTSRELEKNVDFEINGDEVEVDRSILDRIVSPLEHLLRNAVAHGIEADDVRAALNKDDTGKVTIDIHKDGQDLVVTVSDNGAGINVDAIRSKAIANGMMPAESDLSDHDIVQFILEPGFSTAKQVTQISGRGVGLDVVDSEIKQLGGSLDIQSKLGKGTSFIARLPMTLSINQALLVHIQEDIYAVPLNTVEGVVRLSGYELEMVYQKGEGFYEFAGDHYDVKYLGYLLKGRKPGYLEQSAPYPVLLVKSGDLRVGVHVDSLVGRREIVVKPVGAQITTVKGISGATILGDGHVVLILDMAALLRAKTVFQIESQAEEIQREAEKTASRATTVMVVDDSITIRKVTERILTRRGMEVILAKDGLDATQKLQERLPDIMLLDIEMPRMDGYEVASTVRNNEHMKDLPIIMITSRTGAKHKDKALEIGVNRYLGKPYQEDELMENINAVLEETRQAKAS